MAMNNLVRLGRRRMDLLARYFFTFDLYFIKSDPKYAIYFCVTCEICDLFHGLKFIATPKSTGPPDKMHAF